MDSTSENDRDLYASQLRVSDSPEQTLCKNVNLVHRQRHLMEGHLKAMSGTLLAVYLGNLRIPLPRSACNDSSFDSKVAFRHQHSEPYTQEQA